MGSGRFICIRECHVTRSHNEHKDLHFYPGQIFVGDESELPHGSEERFNGALRHFEPLDTDSKPNGYQNVSKKVSMMAKKKGFSQADIDGLFNPDGASGRLAMFLSESGAKSGRSQLEALEAMA